jgi:hypothetical protein
MNDLRRVSGKYDGYSIEIEILSPIETVDKMHFFDPVAITGSMFTTDNALIRSSHRVAHFLSVPNVTWHEHIELTEVLTKDGRVFEVRTNNLEQAEFSCDHLVIGIHNVASPSLRGGLYAPTES